MVQVMRGNERDVPGSIVRAHGIGLIWDNPTIDQSTTDDVSCSTRRQPSIQTMTPIEMSGRMSGRAWARLRDYQGVTTEGGLAVMSERLAPFSVGPRSVATLVNDAGEGDQEAWRELVGRFRGMIASVGRDYGLSEADISELQQTTWLRLVENLHRLKQPERVGGWLATTASRHSLELAKRAARFSPGGEEILARLPDPNDAFSLDTSVASSERTALQRALMRLKPRCRTLLALLLAEDAVGYRELSTLLNMPIGSIGPTRARCLDHLRQLLAEEGVTTFEG